MPTVMAYHLVSQESPALLLILLAVWIACGLLGTYLWWSRNWSGSIMTGGWIGGFVIGICVTLLLAY